ncbi:MAG: polyhydroxyalkanoic acid system family protein [Myxococcota bacterium]
MRHAVDHDLDLPTARRVADKAWESYSTRFAKYDPTIDWVTDHKAKVGFTAKGISLKGELELKAKAIEMDLDVPFLLRPFKSKAISVIDEEIRKWVSKAKNGELD